MASLRFRRHAPAPASWVLGGTAWVVQLFLPWTSSGTFSTSSLTDGLRLIRAGTLSSVAPSWVAPFLLALPAGGLALVAVALVDGPVAVAGRTLLAALGLVLVGVSVWFLADASVSRLGPGGWTAVAGALLTLGAAGLDLRPGRRSHDATTHPQEISP